jgi:hypothetical protein
VRFSPVAPAAQRTTATPGFKPGRHAEETVVDEWRHNWMTQRSKCVTSLYPSELLRDAARAADHERHERPCREIEYAAVFVRRESIGYQLHDDGRARPPPESTLRR